MGRKLYHWKEHVLILPTPIAGPRLVGGNSPREGNVYIGSQPVCDDSWDDKDARVVCRQLGLDFGHATTLSHFGTVPTNFIMDEVACSGSEGTLQSCHHSPSHNCKGSEGAGVVCYEGKHLAVRSNRSNKAYCPHID